MCLEFAYDIGHQYVGLDEWNWVFCLTFGKSLKTERKVYRPKLREKYLGERQWT